jgi:hypothetical protein
MGDFTSGYSWVSGATVTAERLNEMWSNGVLAAAAISGKTAITAVDDTDELLIWDATDAALKRITRANLIGLLNANAVHGQTEKTTPVSADEVLIWDSAASALKRLTFSNLTTLVQPVGAVLQTLVASTNTASTNASGSGGGGIPLDNTIPQNTEGVEILTRAITPAATANKVLVQGSINLAVDGSGNRNGTLALFKNSDANAIWAGFFNLPYSGFTVANFSFLDSPATTSATTYKLRIGLDAAVSGGSFYINRWSGGSLYGGVAVSSLICKEIKG